jgi:GntR family transcriptional repressor for pyruvate dehydrogenase complex
MNGGGADMAAFKPIKQTRASEEVLAQLKEAILRGQVKAGEKLPSERELTEEFQVSRGVVREAIRVLEMTGFVTMRQGPAGGAYVTDVNFDNLSNGFLDLYLGNKLTIPELNQVRMLLEPEMARLAAQNITPEYLVRLERAIAAEREPSADYDERMQRMTEVHFILAEMCGNYLYEAIVNALIKLTHQIVDAVKPEDHNSLHGAGEHDAVARAVINGDDEGAAQAMATHLDKFCKELIRMDQVYKGLMRY